MSFKLHPAITPVRIHHAAYKTLTTLNTIGFCVSCGEVAFDADAEARELICDVCGAKAVYGAEQLMFVAG